MGNMNQILRGLNQPITRKISEYLEILISLCNIAILLKNDIFLLLLLFKYVQITKSLNSKDYLVLLKICHISHLFFLQ
jgi:hypothetical protein